MKSVLGKRFLCIYAPYSIAGRARNVTRNQSFPSVRMFKSMMIDLCRGHSFSEKKGQRLEEHKNYSRRCRIKVLHAACWRPYTLADGKSVMHNDSRHPAEWPALRKGQVHWIRKLISFLRKRKFEFRRHFFKIAVPCKFSHTFNLTLF